jgi:tRNA threonylcarbamoyladenosine biosynthesis protein TsaE
MHADEPSVVAHSARTEETLQLGALLGEAARSAGVASLVVELRGELGAGKTVFVRGMARGLGLSASRAVVSPTFTIARAYALGDGPLRTLHHIDAYRLASADELDAAGFEEMCGSGCVTCVEWGEHVEDALPMDRLRVELHHASEEPDPRFDDPEAPRRIRLEPLGPTAGRVLNALRRLRDATGAAG